MFSSRAVLSISFIGVLFCAAAQAAPIGLVHSATYSQDFNTWLISVPGNGTTQSSPPPPNGWAFSETLAGANTSYTVGAGAQTDGDTYLYGNTGSAERAFGSQRAGALIATIGANFQNNSATPLGSLTISYTGEMWRLNGNINGNTFDRLDFQYSLNATSLTTGTWIDFNALDFISPSDSTSDGQRDGNLAANRTAVSATIVPLAIAPGAQFWLRWVDFDVPGSDNDDGLAVDDFTLSATPEPATAAMMAAMVAAMVAVLSRRRRAVR